MALLYALAARLTIAVVSQIVIAEAVSHLPNLPIPGFGSDGEWPPGNVPESQEDCNDHKGDSGKLNGNMEAAYGVNRPFLNEAHHIVPHGHRYEFAEAARQLLRDFCIDINSYDNGVWLPKTQHRRVHTHNYFKEVNARLGRAANRSDAIAILRGIAIEVRKGTFPR